MRKMEEKWNNTRELLVHAHPYILEVSDRKSGKVLQHLNPGDVGDGLSGRGYWLGVGAFIGVPKSIMKELNDGRRDAFTELL